MPRTRGGTTERRRGVGRGQGWAIEPEEAEVVVGERGGRVRVRGGGVRVRGGGVRVRGGRSRIRLRTRGGRGRGAHLDSSPFYVGDIFSEDPDASTVQVGVPTETALHVKNPRRWDPNRLPEPTPSTSLQHENWNLPDLRMEILQAEPSTSTASRAPLPRPSPATRMEILQAEPSTSTASRAPLPRPSPATRMEILQAEPSTSTASRAPLPRPSPATRMAVTAGSPRGPSRACSPMSISQVPSPMAYEEIQGSPSTTASPSVCGRKRRFIFNVLDPELEDIVNYGSEPDSGTDDEDGNQLHGFLQCPRGERVILDLLDEVNDPMPSEESLPPWPSEEGARDLGPSEASPAPGPSDEASSDASTSNAPTYGPSLTNFHWEELPQPAVNPLERREKFTAQVGPTDSFETPYLAFVSIWDRPIMEHIARETNRYADQKLALQLNSGDIGAHSRTLLFKHTDADELYVFFAIILATGIVVKSDLTEYWSLNQDIFDTPNFSRYMTYTRFLSLGQMLHFVDNEIDLTNLTASQAKVAKIAPITQHLNEKFQALYNLGQCVALDESLTQWKGWLSINQFIKNKAASKGIKTYEVCDSSSGYLWRFKIHAGQNEISSEWGYITSLVLELLEGLENKGHTIFMDNFYNSPLLARLLKSRGLDCVGTLRLNRKYVPLQIQQLVKRPIPVGSVHGATSGDVDVLVWRDRNVVSLISTYHGAAEYTRNQKSKPTLVHDYNVRMGGVDKKDQMTKLSVSEKRKRVISGFTVEIK